MAELDPSLLFATNGPINSIGQINDPRVLADKAQAAFQMQQMQRQQRAQNMLAQVFKQPDSFTPDGQIAPNALKQIMQVDPQTGMAYAKQNRETQLEQYRIQGEQLRNQLATSEIGQAKWGFGLKAYEAGIGAYDAATKAGKPPALALEEATKARNAVLSSNGGQLSEAEEQQLAAHPFDYEQAKVLASIDKDYTTQQRANREEGREDTRLGLEQKREAFTEQHETSQLGLERDRLALETRREKFEEGKPQTVGAGSFVFDPKTNTFINPNDKLQTPYTGGLTPRQRNGGDNSDRVVDAKMGYIANRVGVDIDTPLSPQQLQAFRDAYIQTEGAKGNNVGNLKNPNGQGFQQFGSRQAGVMAIDNQIQRDFKRGQTTIRQLIEGVPQGGGGSTAAGALTPDGIKLVGDQVLAGDKSALQGLGIGKIGSINRAAVRNYIGQQARARGLSGADLAAIDVAFQGSTAEARRTGTVAANVGTAVIELERFAKLALEQSGKINRGNFVPWNKVYQAVKGGFSDPDYLKFNAYNLGVVNQWARATTPTGVPPQAQREKGAQMLMTAQGKDGYRAVLEGMIAEAEAARASPEELRGDISRQITGKPQASSGALPAGWGKAEVVK